jgi:rfaE bifunctional protein nucleotidyltransferase chain/domain
MEQYRMSCVKNIDELKEIIKRERSLGKKIITTNGCYDVIHRGHVEVLDKMSKLGDILIVMINSDESVRGFKGDGRPFNNEEDRALVLSAIKGVDYVIIFDGDNPLCFINEIKPDIHAKGGAGLKERIREEKGLMESWGGEIIVLDLVEGYSSSKLIEKMKKRRRF